MAWQPQLVNSNDIGFVGMKRHLGIWFVIVALIVGSGPVAADTDPPKTASQRILDSLLNPPPRKLVGTYYCYVQHSVGIQEQKSTGWQAGKMELPASEVKFVLKIKKGDLGLSAKFSEDKGLSPMFAVPGDIGTFRNFRNLFTLERGNKFWLFSNYVTSGYLQHGTCEAFNS